MNPFEQAFIFLKNDALHNLIADKILEQYGPEEGMERLRAAPRQVGVLPFDKLANLNNHQHDVLKPEGAEKYPSLLHGLAAREAASNEEPLPSERMEHRINQLMDPEINSEERYRRQDLEENLTHYKDDMEDRLMGFRESPKGQEMEGNLARHQKMNRIRDILGESHIPMEIPESNTYQDRMQLEELRGSKVPAQMAQQKLGIAPGDLPLEEFEQAFPIDRDISMSPTDEHAGLSKPISEHDNIYGSPFDSDGIFGEPTEKQQRILDIQSEHQKNMANQNEKSKMTGFQSLADLFG